MRKHNPERGSVTIFYVSYKQRTAQQCIHSSTQLTHDPHVDPITRACQAHENHLWCSYGNCLPRPKLHNVPLPYWRYTWASDQHPCFVFVSYRIEISNSRPGQSLRRDNDLSLPHYLPSHNSLNNQLLDSVRSEILIASLHSGDQQSSIVLERSWISNLW